MVKISDTLIRTLQLLRGVDKDEYDQPVDKTQLSQMQAKIHEARQRRQQDAIEAIAEELVVLDEKLGQNIDQAIAEVRAANATLARAKAHLTKLNAAKAEAGKDNYVPMILALRPDLESDHRMFGLITAADKKPQRAK